MNQVTKYIFLILFSWNLFLFGGPTSLKAQSVCTIDDAELRYIGNHIAILEDLQDTFTIQQVADMSFNIIDTASILHLGSSSSSFWLKFTIRNELNQATKLSVDQALINYLKLYKQLKNRLFESVELGEHLPFYHRKYPHPVYIFDLNLNKNQTATYYLKVKSDENNTLPVAVSSEIELEKYLSNKDVFMGWFLGVMMVMFLYNFFVFISVRDKSYLYYVIYLATVCITQLSIQGYTFKYIWPNQTDWVQKATIIFACIATFFAIIFVQSFLKLKKQSPRINSLLGIIGLLFILPFIFVLFNQYHNAYVLLNLLTTVTCLLILFISYYFVYKKVAASHYFALAWTFLLIFAIMFSLRDVGVLPHNFLTFYGVIIGSTIEAILLSFALADQINTFRKESIQAVFEKEIVLKEQNSELERLVDQRTQEINQNMIRIEIQNNEKEILLKEIHHRVKNNLQIITSLLSLQNQNIEEVVLKQIFTSSQMRIKSMAIIHELLYQSNNFSKIDYQDYLQHLSQSLLDSYGQPNQDISLHIDAHAIQFNLETAIPLGLIINEAVTNSLKHGFKDRTEGILKISVELMEKEFYKMTIEDNGIGIPKDFNLEKSKSLGTNLMNKLVRQLEGNVTVESGYSGTALHFLFKQID